MSLKPMTGLIFCLIIALSPQAAASSSMVEKHSGKAGLYLRLPDEQRKKNPEYFFRHPLVDALIVTFKWSEIEPAPEKFDFSEIDKMLSHAQKYEKGIVCAFPPYGQSPKDQPTPAWLYDKGVKKITFQGVGASKGAGISVPKVWEDVYVIEYEKFIRKIAERYSHERRIWYILPGIGHIGNIKPQPSKGGVKAFVKAGWTPALWQAFSLKIIQIYQTAFPDSPLLVKAGLWLLRDRKHDNYSKEANELLLKLAEQHVSIITFGLEPDGKSLDKNKVLSRLSDISKYTLGGDIRVGIGDDWPLWVPEFRQKAKPTKGRDEEGLSKELAYAFGGIEGLPKSNISILYVLHPEIDASHPEKGTLQNKEVYRLLEGARERLKTEDPLKRLQK